ncbi:hypothetical protein GBF94_09040 [Staphylococcus aureus]|uniref:Uncharacterized protein n=2 Tax=Staphylococcus aureus TaxID=1280 RepID=A0A345AMF9_STAAU|nr:hypothetical protein B7473_07820 [Staphylococcus aureus]AUJ56357.1 hypothetical protein B7474_02915 [Staphylococcus aureus]AUW99330.1 hypothetical protein B7R57_09375 [Staphylococcus aureus]AVS41838.1 hypothetical protein C9J90_10985 [Staphylococcus aureus]AWR26775.1 hypothetical protein B9Y35_09445 [Staphylococcus aureus]
MLTVINQFLSIETHFYTIHTLFQFNFKICKTFRHKTDIILSQHLFKIFKDHGDTYQLKRVITVFSTLIIFTYLLYTATINTD